MPTELILTSLIGLFSGIISLYTDPNDKRYKIWKFILLLLIVSSAGTTIYFGYHKEKESKAVEEEKSLRIRDLDNNLSQVRNQNSELIQIVKELKEGFSRQFGWDQEKLSNASQRQINQSVEANQALLTASGDVSQRRDITIQYFPKDVDTNIVRATLESLGFRVVTGNPNNQLPTNSIWFGSDVDINSVKAVAYTRLNRK